LFEEEDAGQDEPGEDGGGGEAAEVQAVVGDGFIQEIADDGTEWPGEDESGPEKGGAGEFGPVVRGREQGEEAAKRMMPPR